MTAAGDPPGGAAARRSLADDLGNVVTELRRRLGDVLLARGILTDDQLQEALARQRATTGSRRRLGQVVVDAGMASERAVAEALAELLRLDIVDLNRVTITPEVVRLLPRPVADRARVVVLERSGARLRLAAADPTNVVALDDVRLHTGAAELDILIATESQVRDTLNRVWALAGEGELAAVVEEVGAEPLVDESDVAVDDAPTVRLVNSVLAEGVRARASDIHVEPQRDRLQVRYRVDGHLRSALTAPRAAAPAVISRIKIISGLDIAERRVPQDGRTRITVDGAAVDARVSTLPSMHGEKVVIRLLARAEQISPLPEIGMAEEQLVALRAALAEPQGLVLITGPTGSGKTSTLYAALKEVVSPDRNVVTLEDPVEIQMPGITQVQVHERSGMTFSRGLRAVLRQDPDVILVGEVRDTETAELALRAAMTGHLVLTTLHTNSALAAPGRLLDMGAEPFLIASSLTCAVAQRLARRPCPDCAAPYAPDPATLAVLGLSAADLADATALRGTGCPACGDTGYRGRIGVFEVLPVPSSLRSLLLHPDETALREAAGRLGVSTLRESAVALARAGQTTFEEAVRITPRDS